MNFVINAEQLRKALKDIEAAEANGFMYCEAVFRIVQTGKTISDCKAEYSDLCEKAHPTNSYFNWGRFQGVSKRNKLVDGKLIRIDGVS
jgi:hypothetical protein